MSLLLFDIDGTLLLSGGAGVRAMSRAFEELFGVRDAFANSDIAGRTDTFILSNALRRAGLPDDPATHERFRAVYVRLLQEEIGRPARGRSELMPGVQALLERMRERPSVHLALLTGNFERAAYIKLRHFGIADYFAWGAFGEESPDRGELARAAARRAEERDVPPAARERAIVIGDTPHDIACARVIGARTLAVATGSYSVDQLKDAGADFVLPNLGNTQQVVDLLQ